MQGLNRISARDFLSLLEKLATRADVYVPYRSGKQLAVGRFDAADAAQMEFGGIRQSEPVKSFLVHARKELTGAQRRPTIVAGLKACDLSSLKVQDLVFAGGDEKDPFYLERRQQLTIFSFDCSAVKETCFCLAMEGRPYPTVEFDLNFSIQSDTYLAEAASDKGRAIVEEFKDLFAPAGEDQAELRRAARQSVADQVRDFIAARGTPDAKQIAGTIMKQFNSPLWKDFYKTCVECGACNLACPTCHCFLLSDQFKDDGKPVRFMEWDSCLYSRFARVAGGGNPRKHLWERLRNRFEKKFDFFPKVGGFTACTGCGRCIDACPGDIDIREVLKGLAGGTWNNPPND